MQNQIRASAIERLEPRQLLFGGVAGADLFDPAARALDPETYSYTARVNFGPASAPAVAGYAEDVGAAFAARPDGKTFGWSRDVTKGKVRDSAKSQDDRYDSFLVTRPGDKWELSLPDGQYVVRIAAGDAQGRSTHRFSVEGVSAIDGVSNRRQRWQETTLTVDVADGLLTVDSGGGKIAFIDVYPASDARVNAVATETAARSALASAEAFPTSVQWTTVTPNPLARAEAVGNVVDGKLYVMGGFNGIVPGTADAYIAQVRGDVYNPATNQWNRIADMPQPFSHASAVIVGDTMWFVGGYVGNNPGQGWTKVYKYDISDNRWSLGPSLPEPRGAGGAALIGNTIYFVGGMDKTRVHDMSEHWALDLNRQRKGWVAKPSMPTARNHLSVVAMNDKLYAISGQLQQEADQVALSEVEVYDPATDQWTAMAPMPSPRSHVTSGVFVYGDRIVIVGGETGYNANKRELYAFDPVANLWSIMGELPGERSTMVAGMLADGRIIASTGNSPSPTHTTWIGQPV